LVEFFRFRMKKMQSRRWNCPDESQIAAYADRQLTGHAKDKVEAHLADCDFCLNQVGFLIRIANAPAPDSVPAALILRARGLGEKRFRAEGTTLWHWGKIAAATACLVVVGTIAILNRVAGPVTVPPIHPVTSPTQVPPRVTPPAPKVTPPPPSVRGVKKNQFEVAVRFGPAGSKLTADEIEIRWEPISGAVKYEVEILNLDGDLIWKQTVEGSSIQLPLEVKVEAGHKYFASVRAYLSEGRTVQSAPVAFTVARHK